MIDRHPLEKTHIAKPELRGFDQKAFQKFVKAPLNRAQDFDKEFGVDMSVYRRMNMQSQRTTIKSLDVQNQQYRLNAQAGYTNSSIGNNNSKSRMNDKSFSATQARLSAAEHKLMHDATRDTSKFINTTTYSSVCGGFNTSTN